MIFSVFELQDVGTITFTTPPLLNHLTFGYFTRFVSCEILNKFLSLFSTSLQSLGVIFGEIPTIPFPRLRQLRLLGIHVSTPTRGRFRVNPEKLNLNSGAFPVLESIAISSNVYFVSADSNSGNSQDDWILRTVKNLRIRVTDSPFSAWEMDQIDDQDEDEDAEIISEASAKDYMGHLQDLFPNVTSLTLTNDSDGHEEYLNQLLIEFIQSDGSPKIKELEIQNCEKNYLGHILNGLDSGPQPRFIIENMRLDDKLLKAIKEAFQACSGRSDMSVDKQMETRDGVENIVVTCKAPNMHLKMTGLEKICMSFSEQLNKDSGESGSGIEQDSNQRDLFLMSLPKHLPLLRQIDISHRMFGAKTRTSAKNRLSMSITHFQI